MVAEIHAQAAAQETGETAPEPSGVLRLKTKPKDPEARERRVVLFYIDDVAYSVPARPGAEVALQILDAMDERGQEAGIAFMLKKLLGVDGYRALMNYEGLEREDLQQVITKAFEIVNGALEGPKER
ncbi:hypothetical protein [Actinoallomurus sp. NPDC052274]|uniref:hypothetical protein n=1 Tax=Actinoallomurus sp. NPDC052274 TaxID=3155420 RepID=UPI0034265CA9